MARKVKSASRRQFLKSSAAIAGGLVIGFWLPQERGRALAQEAKKPPVHPNAFLRIGKDGTCTVMVKHLEFGQGVMTSLPMIVAEELECDWSKVRAELAPAAPQFAHTAFGMQMTGGSSSVWNSFDQLRTVGAQARTMLVQAAADQWKVKPADCRAENGAVIGPGGKRATYGQLAEAAGKLPVPEKVTLKDPKNFKVIGKPTRRLDGPDKVEARTVFGLDVRPPGAGPGKFFTAVVAHPPAFGARLKGFNAEKVKAVPGVTHVVQLANGVAIVGNHFWAAKKGRDVLEAQWEMPATPVSTEALGKQFRELAKGPGGLPAKKAANPEAIKGAAKTIVAEYEVPFLAHAAMEPLNCTVEVKGDGAEIWVGSQFQTVDQAAAAKVLGLKPEQVKLNTVMAGGGFGRRANPVSDYINEACAVAALAKVPVKTVWTREDDIKGGFYRPMYVHRAEIGLDANGRIVGWNHAIVGPSIVGGHALRGDDGEGGRGSDVDRGRGRHAVRHPEPLGRLAHREDRCAGALVALGRAFAHRVRHGDSHRRDRRRAEEGPGAAAPRAPRRQAAGDEGAGPRRIEGRMGIAAAEGRGARDRGARIVRQHLRARGRGVARR
jgi:isoquinoline 1-oxidoreductase beta subunit